MSAPVSQPKRGGQFAKALTFGILAHAVILAPFGCFKFAGDTKAPVVVVNVSPNVERDRPEQQRSAQSKPAVAPRRPALSPIVVDAASSFSMPEPPKIEIDPVHFGLASPSPSLESKGRGLGRGTGEGLFDAGAIGNGAGLAVVLDVSGSMKRHSREVRQLLESRFHKAAVAEVVGCDLNRGSAPLNVLKFGAQRKGTHVLYFVCDLQDDEDAEGLLELRSVLLHQQKGRVRLEILSFDKLASPHLYSVVRASGGEVHKMKR